MKTFGKFLAIFIFGLIFLVTGLYLVLNNLSSMLAEDYTGLKCKWVSTGVEISTGGRVERIQLPFPIHIRRFVDRWEIKSGRHVIIINTIPRFKQQ